MILRSVVLLDTVKLFLVLINLEDFAIIHKLQSHIFSYKTTVFLLKHGGPLYDYFMILIVLLITIIV
uniref:Ovule protein n=1 Tax=Heterorhabditis bacteriophora TaxID=37862 RepID=A0A1I7WFM4_HETBA